MDLVRSMEGMNECWWLRCGGDICLVERQTGDCKRQGKGQYLTTYLPQGFREVLKSRLLLENLLPRERFWVWLVDLRKLRLWTTTLNWTATDQPKKPLPYIFGTVLMKMVVDQGHSTLANKA
jgi:hypothetical protein